jgi:hypothetical protein
VTRLAYVFFFLFPDFRGQVQGLSFILYLLKPKVSSQASQIVLYSQLSQPEMLLYRDCVPHLRDQAGVLC